MLPGSCLPVPRIIFVLFLKCLFYVLYQICLSFLRYTVPVQHPPSHHSLSVSWPPLCKTSIIVKLLRARVYHVRPFNVASLARAPQPTPALFMTFRRNCRIIIIIGYHLSRQTHTFGVIVVSFRLLLSGLHRSSPSLCTRQSTLPPPNKL